MMAAQLPARIAVIGLGLIGGSVVRALRASKVHIAAFDNDPATMEAAKSEACIDQALATAQVPPDTVDLIILCPPPKEMAVMLAAQQQALAAGAVLTDVCSIKQPVVAAATKSLPQQLLQQVVPSHPIAGSELYGFSASKASLFADCQVILTPLPQSSPEAVSMVAAVWRACGAADIVSMPATEHDAVLSAASHLPHLLAYSLVAFLADREDVASVIGYSAGGLRDFTRIAASNPDLWLDIALANKDFLCRDMRGCAETLMGLAAALEAGDESHLLQEMQKARLLRQQFAGDKRAVPGGRKSVP